MAEAVLPMSKAMRSMTMRLRVTKVRRTRARFWVGIQLMKLAAIVIGCGIEISADS